MTLTFNPLFSPAVGLLGAGVPGGGMPPGDPAELFSMAAMLAAASDAVNNATGAVGSVVASLAAGTWSSPAATVFDSVSHTYETDLRTVESGLHGAATAIRTYAAVLQQAQAEARAALAAAADAQFNADQAQARLGTATPPPPGITPAALAAQTAFQQRQAQASQSIADQLRLSLNSATSQLAAAQAAARHAANACAWALHSCGAQMAALAITLPGNTLAAHGVGANSREVNLSSHKSLPWWNTALNAVGRAAGDVGNFIASNASQVAQTSLGGAEMLGGGALTALGAGGEAGGVALDATGAGSVVGVPLSVVSAAAVGAGLTVAGVGAHNVVVGLTHLHVSSTGNGGGANGAPENAPTATAPADVLQNPAALERLTPSQVDDLARSAGCDVLPGKVTAANPATRYYLPGTNKTIGFRVLPGGVAGQTGVKGSAYLRFFGGKLDGMRVPLESP